VRRLIIIINSSTHRFVSSQHHVAKITWAFFFLGGGTCPQPLHMSPAPPLDRPLDWHCWLGCCNDVMLWCDWQHLKRACCRSSRCHSRAVSSLSLLMRRKKMKLLSNAFHQPPTFNCFKIFAAFTFVDCWIQCSGRIFWEEESIFGQNVYFFGVFLSIYTLDFSCNY